MKLGRRRPAKRSLSHLCLHNYVTRHLPTPPASCDYSPAAASPLGNVYLNDQLGDCVIAAGYHMLAVWTGNAGTPFTATSQQITADYSAIGGYVPGRPATDQGCDEQTALNYWTNHGFRDGSKLLGWLAVDPTNHALMMQALWLFEGLFFAMELPDAWVNNEPQASGFTWGVAGDPDPSNGHAIMAYGYGPAGYKIDTWGLLGYLTSTAGDKYLSNSDGGECYVAVTEAMLSKASGKAGSGIDDTAMRQDFNAIGGNLPVPAPPAPTPVPTPTPTPVFNADIVTVIAPQKRVVIPSDWTSSVWTESTKLP